MKRNSTTILFIFLFSVFSSCFVNAETKILTPSDDTYTYSNNTIRGMEPLLKTYHSTAGSQFRRISFLKFDISTLSPFVESAKLRLYTNGFIAGSLDPHQFDIYPVSDNRWSEDDVTFTNYVEKLGADVNTPLLASYVVPQGDGLEAGYIEFSDPNLVQYITDALTAGDQFVSFRMREKYSVKDGAGAVIVEFHSKEHESGFAPELVVGEKSVEQLKLSDIKVDNVTIDDFTDSNYRNVVLLPWNETVIPTVTATAKDSEATVVVMQATSLTESETERTARINVQIGSDILTYFVVFELLPPPTDASLSDIQIDGNPLEFFDASKMEYTVFLPYTTTSVPSVAAQPSDPHATYQVFEAESINPHEPESNRTTEITVKSADQTVTEIYKIIYHKLPELDIILAIGQSNMAGRAPFADVTDPIHDVYLLTPSGDMELAANPMNKHSNIRKDIGIQGLSPAYTCATTLQSHVEKPIGFVVNALGGSAITSWYQPGKTNYDASLERAIDAQRFGTIRAIIWHQGESDVGGGRGDNYAGYKANLLKLVQNFRIDLNEPDLFFICGELSQKADRADFNTAVVRDVANYIPNSDFVITDGTSLLADGIHFDEPSVKLLGERYAEKIIQNLYNSTVVPLINKNELFSVTQFGKQFKIQNHENDGILMITDLLGRNVFQKKILSHSSQETNLNKGVYVIRLSTMDNTLAETMKIIVQ